MLVGSVVEPQAGDNAILTTAKKVSDDPGIDAASVSDRKDGNHFRHAMPTPLELEIPFLSDAYTPPPRATAS